MKKPADYDFYRAISVMVTRVGGVSDLVVRPDEGDVRSGLLLLRRRWPDDESALASIEAIRWPGGRRCPRCGNTDIVMKSYKGDGHHTRWYCVGGRCVSSRTFGVRTRTFMHKSKLPHHWWLYIIFILVAYRNRVSPTTAVRLLEGAVSVRGISLICERMEPYFQIRPVVKSFSGHRSVAVKLYLEKRQKWHDANLANYRRRYRK